MFIGPSCCCCCLLLLLLLMLLLFVVVPCQVLSVPVEHIKLEQVDKAEAALLSLRRLLDEGADPQGQGTAV